MGSLVTTILITIGGTGIPILVAALAGYAFAWLDFPGRDWLFVLVIALLVVPLQLAQGLVQGQQAIGGVADAGEVVQGDAPPPAAVADRLFAAGVVDEDAAHGLGGGGEEMASTGEGVMANESEVGLVDPLRGCPAVASRVCPGFS